MNFASVIWLLMILAITVIILTLILRKCEPERINAMANYFSALFSPLNRPRRDNKKPQ